MKDHQTETEFAGHTPEPWEKHPIDSVGGFNITSKALSKDAYHGTLAVAIQRDPHPESGGGISWSVCEANARLIAAAPTLLRERDEARAQRDALREALISLRHADGCFCEAAFSGPGCYPSHSPECESARAAIAACQSSMHPLTDSERRSADEFLSEQMGAD